MEEKDVIEKFAIIKKRQYYAITPIAIVSILLIALLDDPEFTILQLPRESLYIIAIIGLVFALIFSLKNWRCPSCDAYLRKNINPKFCPKCGAKLQAN